MILSLSIVIKGKTGNFEETTPTGEIKGKTGNFEETTPTGEIHCKEEYFNRITLTNNWEKPAGKINYGINNPLLMVIW